MAYSPDGKEALILKPVTGQIASRPVRTLRGRCQRMRFCKRQLVKCPIRTWCHAWVIVIAATLTTTTLREASAQIHTPTPTPQGPVVISAASASRWQEGSYEVWWLQGHCQIQQGRTRSAGEQAVVWIERSDWPLRRPHKIITYFEGNVTVQTAPKPDNLPAPAMPVATLHDAHWHGRFVTTAPIQLQVPHLQSEPLEKPPVYQRALQQLYSGPQGSVQKAQFVTTNSSLTAVQPTRQIAIYPRSSVHPRIESFVDSNTNERVVIYEQGIDLIISGPEDSDTLEILADRVVVWTDEESMPEMSGNSTQSDQIPLEIYLEGNVVFRQGSRVIYARSMFYNVRANNGTILEAEALTPLPQVYEGLVRLKADVLQQLDKNQFQAYGASITSSRLGFPQYWLQSENIYFRHEQKPRVNPYTGEVAVDPTGTVIQDNDLLAVSRNNSLYLFGLPVFYWPTIVTDLADPFYYINSATVSNDNVYGSQIRSEWNLYQLLGIDDPPDGTTWDLSLDYLSERGFGYGTHFDYERPEIFGIAGATSGFVDAWFISDHGLDNLGLGRRALAPGKDFRGRLQTQHRQLLANGWQVSGEVGWISDRNFLEQYYEWEWDQEKDQTTGIEIKRLVKNRSLNFSADLRVNRFFSQTEGPRADHFLLGGSLLNDRLTYYQHTNAGYLRLGTARLSADPADPAASLPWEVDGAGIPYDHRHGVRFATRHELDYPLQLWHVKVVPFVAGEVAHWGQDRDGDDVTRLLGQGGVRASLPFTKINPGVQSKLLNLNGLAHKINLESELMFADANRDLARFPLYDPLQDDSIEASLRRAILFNFGGTLPVTSDDRFYALRSGMQSWVASPSTEIADDLTTLRMGVRQRWQTKRGLDGQQRIIDWITLDVHGTFFPKSSRDNFGEDMGLVDYNFRWHVGDRVTLLSDGIYDFFPGGLQKTTLGTSIRRPGIGSFYVGLRSYDGPITSNILSTSLNYRMSHKWLTTVASGIDLSNRNIGQVFHLTRIGESFLIGLGATVDKSKGSVGARFTVEPRILARSQYAYAGGVPIPTVGVMGLE